MPKFAIWVGSSRALRVIQVLDGVPISACVQSRGSREHSADIWCVVRPMSYACHTTMGKVYLHVISASFILIYSLPLVRRPKDVLMVVRIVLLNWPAIGSLPHNKNALAFNADVAQITRDYIHKGHAIYMLCTLL